VGEELYAVVLIRIVRRGNDHTGLKIILANEASDAGGSYDAGESDRGPSVLEPRGE
jgi:hypothetical protein